MSPRSKSAGLETIGVVALLALLSGCESPATPELRAPTPPSAAAPAAPVVEPREPEPSEPEASEPEPATPAVEPVESPPTAPALPPPSSGDVDLVHAVPTAIAVSSVYRDQTAQIARLVDGDPATAWNSRSGELTAAWIEVRVPSDATVSGIALTAGFAREGGDTDLFTGNLRVRAVRVLRDGQEIGRFELDPESRALQTLPVAGPGGAYRIEIAELVPGARADWQEVCVSELRVLGRSPSARAGAYEPATAIGALPDAASATAAPPLPPEDAAYFVSREGILRVGDDGRFRRVHASAIAVVASPDGVVYARGPTSLEVVAGAPRGRVEMPPGFGSVSRAELGAGTIWLLGSSLARWDGASWTTWSTRTFGDRILDLWVEPDGTAHVLTPDAVFTSTADGFARAPTPALRREYGQPVGRFVRNTRALTVADRRGAWRRESGTWVADDDAARSAYRADGSRITLRANGDLVHTPASGAPTTVALSERGVHAESLRGRWDAQGRFWGETDVGLVVLEPDLSIARWYAPGSIPGLGAGTPTLVIVGAGPRVLPEAREPDGHVRGTITSSGAPLGGALLVLCADADVDNLHSFDSPCGGAEWLGRTTTRPDGSFELWAVPEAIYGLAVRREDGSWYVSRRSPCCTPAVRGRAFEIPPIDVGAR